MKPSTRSPATASKQPSTQQRILHYNRLATRFLYLAVAAGFLAAVFVVGSAGVLSIIVNQVFLEHSTLAGVEPWLAVLFVLALLRAAAVWAQDVLAQRSASGLKSSLRQDLTQRFFALGPAYTRRQSSGDLVHATVEGVEMLDEYMAIYQPVRLLARLVPVFVALVVLYLDPPTVLVLLFTGPLLLFALALIGGRTKEITERRFRELSWLSSFFLDMLQGMATLKLYGRSREQIDNIRKISSGYGNTTMEVLQTAFQSAFVLEFGGTIATALVAVEISLRLMSGALPFERALAVLIITPEFFLPLRQYSLRYHAGAAGKAAAERIFASLDAPLPASPPAPLPALLPKRYDLVFDNVRLAYENGSRPALKGFSLSIAQGETVALVGESGAGKSTVANLLLRFIEPDGGVISAGGTPLAGIAPELWRNHVAWVPQAPHLFHGTVADNIRLARPDTSQAEIITAAQAAHAHEFIQAMPQGYDTLIGENGARLSGGQQQRLAIARAFLKDAPLLVFDEGTSHLDAQSEIVIQDALFRLKSGRTVLIIAHRLRMAAVADRIVVMERGRVIEEGSPSLLLTAGGAYGRLVAAYQEGMA